MSGLAVGVVQQSSVGVGIQTAGSIQLACKISAKAAGMRVERVGRRAAHRLLQGCAASLIRLAVRRTAFLGRSSLKLCCASRCGRLKSAATIPSRSGGECLDRHVALGIGKARKRLSSPRRDDDLAARGGLRTGEPIRGSVS